MTRPHDIIGRHGQADVAALAAAYPHIQPPSSATLDLRWASASDRWRNRTGNGSYVDCQPCADHSGSGAVAGVTIRIYLPRTLGCDPNVEPGGVLGYLPAAGGVYVAVTGHEDAMIGTVRMWAISAGDPPLGWTECKNYGTSGRPNPIVNMTGTFPVGQDANDSDFDTVAVRNGQGVKEHCHAISIDAENPPCGSTNIDTGTWETREMSSQKANHLPPWTVVRFIERYDNSANE